MSNVGIPIKLLYEAEGMKVTVEVRSSWSMYNHIYSDAAESILFDDMHRCGSYFFVCSSIYIHINDVHIVFFLTAFRLSTT